MSLNRDKKRPVPARMFSNPLTKVSLSSLGGHTAIGLNLPPILPSYSIARPAIQTPVFRLLPSQTIERICALERLPALG